jgi:hypothetical protein
MSGGFAVSNVINLHPSPIDLDTDRGRQFVVDCVRAAEELISDREIQEIYELTPVDWNSITKDVALIRAIRAERARRVRNGTAARESAARHFVRAPGILSQIMDNEQASPRHRIEAAKEIRQVAAGHSDDGPSQGEKFSIVINLGADSVERYEFDVTPNKQLAPDHPEDKPDGNEW